MSEAQKFLLQYTDALTEARRHAREAFPEESCGFIVRGRYIPAENIAQDPATHIDSDGCKCRLCVFEIADSFYLKHAEGLDAVVHSHPNGPAYPSRADMLHQQASAVTWIILTLDETRFGPTLAWGGACPMEPLIGREFIHGITDCYALIRDVYALGREELAKQGIEWPFDPITLPLGERDDSWWLNDHDNDLYQTNYPKAGFKDISVSQVKPGDVFLGRIRSDKLNHGGVLLGENLILHHLPNRLSRREPAGIWSRCADKWIRYVGVNHA